MYKGFFRKRQSRVVSAGRLMLFLNNTIKRRAQKAAQSLSNKAQKLSQTQLRRRLYVFAIVGILLNGGIIIVAFKNHPEKTGFSVTNISKPHFKTTDYRSATPNRSAELAQLKKLEKLLDSLQQTKAGKKQLTQFMEKHPRFRDSLQLFKNLYGVSEGL